jgi:hypothetical protein
MTGTGPDPTTTAALNSLQAQISQLMSVKQGDSFAPNSTNPYIVPGPRDFYSYTQRVAIAGAISTTVALTFQIEADSYFYMNALSYQADSALAGVTHATNVIPLVTLVLFDSGSGRQLMGNAVPLNCLCGEVGGQPFRLPKPRRFAPTSQIQATLVNYSANAYNLSLCLSGFKVYANQAIAVNGPVGS